MWALPAAVVLGVALVAVAMLVGLRSSRPGALPGTTVAGVDVGGLEAPALLTAVDSLGVERRQRVLAATRGTLTVSANAATIGYLLDGQATVEAILRRGRQANPVTALRDQLMAFVSAIEVDPVESFDEIAFQRWVDTISADLGLDPLEGEVRVIGEAVEVVPPEAGETIDVPALRAAALAAMTDPDVSHIQVPITTAAPEASREELAALAAEAQRAISGPVTLSRGEVTLTFTPEQIGQLLEVHVAPRAGDGRAVLVLGIDHESVTASITAGQFGALNIPAQDATFTVAGDRAHLVPAVDGFRFDARLTAAQLLEVATSPGPRTAVLQGQVVPPDLTTEQASGLGIVERVATFTTEHPCCEGRVRNIQRMADLVRGAIVRPGETFSLNARAGERTLANGFVDGGAIQAGEFVEEIGGGVSQFTTTLFNTVFFSGHDIVEFRPHSYYIPRYPLGREATLNFDPPIDLKFTNDSPHGIYIHTAYTDTSVTVAFYSTTFAQVDATTGDPYGFRPPPEERERTDELPEGEERIVQRGRDGFSVDFARHITYVDGRTVTEQYTTNYLPEPRIIEVGTARPDDPTEEPSAPPSEPRPTEVPTSAAPPPPPAPPPAAPPPAAPPPPPPAAPPPAAPPPAAPPPPTATPDPAPPVPEGATG